MPYKENEKIIHTKVRGVALSDNAFSRQNILRAMHEKPEDVKIIYRKEMEIFVFMDSGDNFCLGYLHEKYSKILHEKITKIISWKVTGGYPLNDSEYKNIRARMGLNLTIQILD
jgi:hypothetical protein